PDVPDEDGHDSGACADGKRHACDRAEANQCGCEPGWVEYAQNIGENVGKGACGGVGQCAGAGEQLGSPGQQVDKMDDQIGAEQCAHDAVLAARPLVLEEMLVHGFHGHSISMRVGSGLMSTPSRGT